MKRHVSLEPFSRDHNVGLVIARGLCQGEDCNAALRLFLSAWNMEFRKHFREEEALLENLCTSDEFQRLCDEHEAIRLGALAARRGALTEENARNLGALLHDHIRWEERSLFPSIERRSTPEELDRLWLATFEHEKEQWSSPWHPRRRELVMRSLASASA